MSVSSYGAVGDNNTDNTAAFRGAIAAVVSAGGGEVIVPAQGLFKTGPVNLTSNVRLTVEGEMWALEDLRAWPQVPPVFTYATLMPTTRYQPFIWVPGETAEVNISVAGSGEINGAGPFFWTVGNHSNYNENRPHLLSVQNVTGFEVTGVTLRNSAFWSLRPIFSRSVWIHDMQVITPWCDGDVPGGPGGPNTDGMDIDSCEDVVVERCFISVGDDHVTVLAGAGEPGRAAGLRSRNVTVRDNRLGTGMGLSVGSSVSGGVEDVLFTRNIMEERPQDWGMGAHLKTRVQFGGFIRNIAYIDNVFPLVTNGGIFIETDYQSAGECNATTCTEIRDIVFRNFTGNARSAGTLGCAAARPCINITLENVHINASSRGGWACTNVSSGTFVNVTPPGLAIACGLPETPTLAPLPAPAPVAAPACVDDGDCSLNGVCTATGVCACDAPWQGAACEQLAFAPTSPTSGKNLYNAGSSENNTWNGPIITGEDGLLYAYVPLYKRGSLGGPFAVLRGVATSVAGPYTWETQPELPAAINPAAVAFTDPATGARVFSLWLGGRVFVAASAGGPWTPSPGATYPGVNPAPVFHGGAWYLTNQATAQVWTAPRLGASWTLFANISHAALPAGIDYHVEDPFMWIDARGGWHIINHAYANAQCNACGTSDVSAHFFSQDGIAWRYSRQPYGHTVRYSDGSAHTYTTLERPNLHFAPGGGGPLFITLAADLVTGDAGCANRTGHAHNGHTPCDNCKWDDLAGTTVVQLAAT